MQTETLLYILLAGFVALLMALFQYVDKAKKMFKLSMIFAFLRFISVFAVLLLLINPKFDKVTFIVEKPNLLVAIDNSSSIKHLKQDQQTRNVISDISNNNSLKNKFNIQYYTFGESLKTLDSLLFSEQETNIHKAFSQLHQIYKQTTSPTVLITDGNQTYGNDYQYITNTYNQPIYPIIVGDTITHVDLKIEQLNVNKYAYLKNKFPVEAILVYNGSDNITSNFVVSKGNTTVFKEVVNFSKNNNSKVLNITLPANSIGINYFKASLTPLENEKNKVNNTKNFAVDIINQNTKIAIVSDFTHPDLGALKNSIESNEQRSVSFLNTKDILNQLNDFQLIILYQPNYSFKEIYKLLKLQNTNKFVIIGTKTNLDFINSLDSNYTVEKTNQTENYQAELNSNYQPFILEDIHVESFPPLHSNYGSAIFSVPFETILNKTLHGVSIQEPLLATIDDGKSREAVLFGENIWKWRSQSYTNSKSFNEFDDFIGKIIQYLDSNKQKSRLQIYYESFYNGSNTIQIKAEYFDENYVFDTRETLQITVTNKITKEQKTLPLILKNNNYQVDLSNLPPSEYTFSIKASKANLSKSGNFQVLEYNVEQQFLSANTNKLKQLASASNGATFYINNTENLATNLLNDNRYKPIQKSHKNTLSLIDWKYLLAVIALSLGIEWFLRKYNGLI